MRRYVWWAVVILVLAVGLTACGKKDAASVVSDLTSLASELKSYTSVGEMVLQTGTEPQTYEIEVWYKDPHFYRIELKNTGTDLTQIVLRNDDGVFVLTPHLNKSFRFQSDWPEKHGLVYLYQSIIGNILNDENRQFLIDGEHYVFEIAVDSHNHSLSKEKIWLHQNYSPDHVEVYDAQGELVAIVSYDNFEFDKAFDDDAFEMDRNMTTWRLQTNFMTEDLEASATDASPEITDQASVVYQPTYVPEGVRLIDILDTEHASGSAVLLRYAGDYQYTLMQLQPTEQTIALFGDLIDLGSTLGMLSYGGAQQTLHWTYDGVEFRLASPDLPVEEMSRIAQSIMAHSGK